jgi:ABC-2 type transport system ATP-binding protein
MESVEQLCDDIALINKSEKVLEGSVKQVREQFRTHIFNVECTSPQIILPDTYQMSSSKQLDNKHFVFEIKKPEHEVNNILLKELLNQTEIIRFAEMLPTMSQIFIDVVNAHQPNKILTVQ